MRLGDAPWRSLRKEAFDVTRAARAARGTPRLGEAAELLHGQALIAEGGAPKDPRRFGQLVTELLLGSVKG